MYDMPEASKRPLNQRYLVKRVCVFFNIHFDKKLLKTEMFSIGTQRIT